ncbi:MAG: Ig-like domain-containing protein, partial [Oscillospiraceae bacterium]|nr:Ig-like domain-containing protein [Oscillospiraceae bacterium]
SMSELLGEDCTVCFNGDAPVNAGSYICVAANISANYNTVIAPGFLTIDPIEIIVTMDNVTKVIGEEDPEFTYTVEGEVLEGHELVVKPYRAEGETIGRYWIDAETEVINGGENYEIVFKSGRLKIEKVDLELAAEELAFTQWNESFDLEPIISQDCVSLEEIVWSSSDESVARVINGVVTAVGNGEATITATVRGIEFECDVNCTLPVAKAETVRENGEVTAVKVNVEDLLTNFDKPEEGKTEGRTCTVIVGFYANGRLVSTRIFENTDGSSITIDKPEGADTVKIFVLDNTEDLPPLCRESVLELF